MPSLNKVILIGNITADLELKKTPNGVSTCSFAIGVQRNYKNADGSYSTDFINIVAWRSTAEFICKYFKKGKPILICGSIQVRSYNTQNGGKGFWTEVVADEAHFVEKKGAGESDSYSDVPQTYSSPAFSSNEAEAADGEGKFEELSSSDDLPF